MRASGRATQHHAAAAPAGITIGEDELMALRAVATSPVMAKKGGLGQQRDREAAERKKEVMRAHDFEALRLKAESGALEGEAVEALVKKLERGVKDTTTVQRFLAEERKAHVVVTLAQQLEHKKAREASARAYEEELYAATVRSMAAGAARDQEAARAAAAKKAAVTAELDKQLHERAYAKMMEVETREQESELLAAAARRGAEAAERAAVAKKEAQKQKARETAESNKQFAERDAVRKQREREADEAIRVFQLDKAAREEAAERARRAEEEAKKKRQAEMLAEQERANDNRAAEDEARARAHEEKRILADRARSRAEAEKKDADRKLTAEALRMQLQMKEARKAEAAAREAELSAMQVRAAVEAVQREAEALHAKKRADFLAKSELVAQKAARDRLKAEELKRPLEERRQQALVEAAEKIVVERYRESVRGRMEAANLPKQFVKAVGMIVQRP